MKTRHFNPFHKPAGSRALKLHVNNMTSRTNPRSFIMMLDEKSFAQRLQSDSGWADPRGRVPVPLQKWTLCLPVLIYKCMLVILWSPSVRDHFRAMDKMDSASKPSLTPQERIELIRAELESIKATTAKNKWEMLAMEMQDIKDDLSDEIQAGLKDAANLMGDLGKRLCKLELQVEELTTALGKISEATAEASSKKGH
jgi:hypothetical protein